MSSFPKPRIVISKCIEFDHCRYNGQTISSDQVKELRSFIEFIPICPEVEIGLGIPRDPIRIIFQNDQRKLVQPATKKDVTKPMNDFIQTFFNSLENVDGFILKSRSKVPPIKQSAGFFGEAVINKFSFLAIEDEGRLRNHTIREHFLRKIFAFASFRAIKQTQDINELINFHTTNKLLLMAYNQKKLKMLGQIIAKYNKKSKSDTYKNYEAHLQKVFYHPPQCTRNINVLMHSFGFVSSSLSKNEKEFFLTNIDQYRNGQASLASLTSIMKSWIIRFNHDYLLQQTFFQPYPEELVHAANIDSCQNRDYWK
jgi:uncharacterized protein YbgA (DUF1722 family)